jgi:hypothetical protein
MARAEAFPFTVAATWPPRSATSRHLQLHRWEDIYDRGQELMRRNNKGLSHGDSQIGPVELPVPLVRPVACAYRAAVALALSGVTGTATSIDPRQLGDEMAIVQDGCVRLRARVRVMALRT